MNNAPTARTAGRVANRTALSDLGLHVLRPVYPNTSDECGIISCNSRCYNGIKRQILSVTILARLP